MSEPGTDPPRQDQLLEEAAAWFARMRGPDAEASRREFDAWLARGALHRSAYNRAAEIFAMGKLLGDANTPATSSNLNRRPQRHRQRRLAAATAAVLLVAAAGTWLIAGPASEPRDVGGSIAANGFGTPAGAARLVTGPGETRAIRLADGSRVILAADTMVAADFDVVTRNIALRRGQARFEVAQGQRPFVVHAGGGSVTALGTIFDVALSQGRSVSVRLIEGAVEVAYPEPADGAAARPALRRLQPGETISFTATRAIRAEARVAPRPGSPSRSSPTFGQYVREYDGIRVAELVVAANRTASRPIRIADPRIGKRRISGRFRVDDTDLLAERIAALFDLAVDRSDPAQIVLTPK